MCSRGKVIHSEARNIIRNVIEFFDQQKKTGCWSFPVEKSTELAAAATGKPISFIKTVRKEAEVAGSSKLKSPKKARTTAPNKIELNLVKNACMEITQEEWEKHCVHVKHIEEEMWKADSLTDDVTENFTFMVNTGSSDEDEWGTETDNSDCEMHFLLLCTTVVIAYLQLKNKEKQVENYIYSFVNV
ncbi:hypothetical protein RI129_002823 [Pyrocoelia pectoralis]|uniref:Uncharacterized protein n=1 Tax=Pyrocoelia pectoralis TaxID=417401 RepID=A0AAN7ZTS3_9COLE